MKRGPITPTRKKWTFLFGILAIVGLGFCGFEFWQWVLPFLQPRNATGSFSVSSAPSGAVVHWKGGELGHTPLRQCVLPAGDQVIEIIAPGYQPCPIELTIRTGSVTDLGLRPLVKQLGKLRLVTDPVGVSYSVIGPDKKTIAGVTPDTIENLPFGKYDVRLIEPGWPAYVQPADINSTSPVGVSREFKGGSVELSSDPTGATIFVGGAKLGTAPLTANLPIGPVEVTSRFGTLGSLVQTLVPDGQRTVSFHFKHSYGTVLVSSDRTDAVLIVDGVDCGHPPAQLFLAPGSHKLLLSAPNAADKTRRVDLIEDQHVSVQINLGTMGGQIASTSTPAGSPTPAPTLASNASVTPATPVSPPRPAQVAARATSTPTPVPATTPAPTPASNASVTPATPVSPPRSAQLETRATPTPTPVPASTPVPESNQVSGSSSGPSPTPDKSAVSEDQPMIPPANAKESPSSTPHHEQLEQPKLTHVSSRLATATKKVSAAVTPSLPASPKPEQAKSKKEAFQLLDSELKAKQEALNLEKQSIEYQIKNFSGSIREQWKYRLAQWRLKKTRFDQDRAAEEARLKEQWR